MTDNTKVLVCDKCLTASCWHGEFMCQESTTAGLKLLTIRDLKKLNREHEEHWSDATMIKIYGNADREFSP